MIVRTPRGIRTPKFLFLRQTPMPVRLSGHDLRGPPRYRTEPAMLARHRCAPARSPWSQRPDSNREPTPYRGSPRKDSNLAFHVQSVAACQIADGRIGVDPAANRSAGTPELAHGDRRPGRRGRGHPQPHTRLLRRPVTFALVARPAGRDGVRPRVPAAARAGASHGQRSSLTGSSSRSGACRGPVRPSVTMPVLSCSATW